VCAFAQAATVAQLRIGLSKHFVSHPDPTPDPTDIPANASNASGDDPTDRSDDPARPSHDPARASDDRAGRGESESGSRRLVCGFDDDGDYLVHALADAVDGALIDQALREARDALRRGGNRDVTWLDALLEICARSLGSVTSVSRRELFKVIVHLDHHGAWIHHGPPLPTALLAEVSCDTTIQPWWTSASLPVDVGRTRHIVP
jgi:hypothetical protein